MKKRIIAVFILLITILISGVYIIMSERNYYVICDDNCKFEGMTKEQIIAAITEATGVVPTGIDDAFITKIKEMNAGGNLKFWTGTTAEFEAIEETENGVLYILTDDDTEESLESDIAGLESQLNAFATAIVNGTQTVGKAEESTHAETADSATSATSATNAANATRADVSDCALSLLGTQLYIANAGTTSAYCTIPTSDYAGIYICNFTSSGYDGIGTIMLFITDDESSYSDEKGIGLNVPVEITYNPATKHIASKNNNAILTSVTLFKVEFPVG